MDIGVHLPHLGRGVNRDGLISFAQRLDELGVHSGWVSDHVCWPSEVHSKYPYTPDGSFPATPDMAWLDPLGTLLFVAGCTERIRLGITVLILPYRPPVLTAKQIATLDVLSNGRVILGVGVGWMREEFEVLGMPYDNRGARADEQIEVFTKLFKDAEPSHDGRFYQFPTVGFEPKPIQNPIPIWVGGATEPAYKRTARIGHGFHAAFEPLADLAHGWQRIRELATEYGRNPDDITFSVRWYLDPDGAMPPEKSVAGSREQMIDTVGQLTSIGVTHLGVDPVARGGQAGRLAAVEAFMTDVVPAV